jgi:hypothetical protein
MGKGQGRLQGCTRVERAAVCLPRSHIKPPRASAGLPTCTCPSLGHVWSKLAVLAEHVCVCVQAGARGREGLLQPRPLRRLAPSRYPCPISQPSRPPARAQPGGRGLAASVQEERASRRCGPSSTSPVVPRPAQVRELRATGSELGAWRGLQRAGGVGAGCFGFRAPQPPVAASRQPRTPRAFPSGLSVMDPLHQHIGTWVGSGDVETTSSHDNAAAGRARPVRCLSFFGLGRTAM